jgi:hypothetical protein
MQLEMNGFVRSGACTWLEPVRFEPAVAANSYSQRYSWYTIAYVYAFNVSLQTR